MIFQTIGERTNPAIRFFHAMGVNKEGGKPVYEYLKDKYYFILPTSTVYCENHPDPHLYFAIKSLYWTKGGSLKKIL